MGGSKPAVNGLFNLSISKIERCAEKRANRPATAWKAHIGPVFGAATPFLKIAGLLQGLGPCLPNGDSALFPLTFASRAKSGLTAAPYGGRQRESAGCGW
jgi:hypothetical protein